MNRQSRAPAVTSQHWYFFSVLVLLCITALSSVNSQSLSTTIAAQTATPSSSSPASSFPLYELSGSSGLTCNNLPHHSQREMCRKMESNQFLRILKHAEWLTAELCQTAFRDERWNCSGLSVLRRYSVTETVNKEAAFIRALSSAALAYTIARACRQNITSCPENTSPPTPTTSSRPVIFEGRSDNITYGLEIAKEFFEDPVQFRSHRNYVILHNHKAGRVALKSISDDTPLTCRCHGLSASCSIQTCYKLAPNMQTVAAFLKRLYQRSCKVYSNQLHGNQHAYISNCTKRAPQDKELINLESSPNYCYRDLAKGSLGVSGRSCELRSDSSPGSCNHLCCGRGRVSTKVTEEVDCECRFVWCCHIDCKKCRREKTVYHCK